MAKNGAFGANENVSVFFLVPSMPPPPGKSVSVARPQASQEGGRIPLEKKGLDLEHKIGFLIVYTNNAKVPGSNGRKQLLPEPWAVGAVISGCHRW